MMSIKQINESINVGDQKNCQNNEILIQIKSLGSLSKSFREKPVNTDEKFNSLDPNSMEKKSQCVKLNENRSNSKGRKYAFKRKGDTAKSYFQNFMAELIGTGLLMFLGCMGCIPQVDTPPAVHHMSSLSFGLVVLLIIQIFGHLSGAHLNPAVTISTVIFKMISPVMGLVYIVAQFFGGLLGFGLLRILMPREWVVNGFCATKPHAKTTTMQAVAIETIITCVLILVCCGVWDKRNERKQDSTPARFGFIIVAISMVAGPLTGASMNTARSFPPAFFDGDFTNHWIYWVGPNVGSVIACGLYQYLFAFDEKAEEESLQEKELEDVNHHMLSEKS